VIPAGVYPARATRHQWGYTEGGKEQVLIEFQITGDTSETGTLLAWFGYFTDKTWERTLEALRYCGWEGDDLAAIGELDKDVEIVVEHEEDESGVVRAKVRWVNRPGGGRVQLKKPMSEGELRHFAASMKNRAKNVGARPGKARSSALDSSNDTSPPDDDIPF
jgi:hypothetical protein